MRNHVPAETAKNLPPIPKRIFLNPDQQNHRHPSTTNTALLNFLKTYYYVSFTHSLNQSFHQIVFVKSIRKNNKRIAKELEEKLSFTTYWFLFELWLVLFVWVFILETSLLLILEFVSNRKSLSRDKFVLLWKVA